MSVLDFTDKSILMNMFWFPPQNSSFAAEIDNLYAFIFWLSTFFFVLIIGLGCYFLYKYRRVEGVEPEKSPSHNTTLELTWTIVPSILVVFIFGFGFVGWNDMQTIPPDATTVNVIASQWNWSFIYDTNASDENLHVKVGEPVRLVMRSEDVIHSLFIPACRAKRDVVPGRYNEMWFDTINPGVYVIHCTEYCGDKHSDMNKLLYVHPPEKTEEMDTYDAWMKIALDPTLNVKYQDDDKNFVPAKYGEALYQQRGCKGCHSIDGSQNTGPSFKNNWGTERVFGDGTKGVMDENYVRESLLYPGKLKRVGYTGKNMPSYSGQLKDIDIDSIIAYLKTLKE